MLWYFWSGISAEKSTRRVETGVDQGGLYKKTELALCICPPLPCSGAVGGGLLLLSAGCLAWLSMLMVVISLPIPLPEVGFPTA